MLFFLKKIITPIAVILIFSYSVFAESDSPTPDEDGISNELCLSCHATPGLTFTFESGEQLYISIDQDKFNQDVHGSKGYACIQCHTDIKEFPHDPISATSMREFVLSQYQTCYECHTEKYSSGIDDVHQNALAGGINQAAVCSDCHGAHDITHPHEPRTKIPTTCQKCHSQIYDFYKESVHGQALISGNTDVPTCIDCHGVHQVSGPTRTEFHLMSPDICAKCHTDPDLMAKYGIKSDVYDTYLADFHGTTVLLFEKLTPDQETNKPVCVDCHSVHSIKKHDDPESTVMKENLLVTCQKCHPDAESNFPTAWLGHYQPDPNKFPLVYFINLFYKILIPTTIAGMLFIILSDLTRKFFRRKFRTND